jgi:hypothetical protein
MQEKIRFQKNVPSDIDEILESFLADTTTNRVRSSIARTFELVEAFPKLYAVVYDDIRLVKTKDYPILIQFRVVDDIPIILSLYFSGGPPAG